MPTLTNRSLRGCLVTVAMGVVALGCASTYQGPGPTLPQSFAAKCQRRPFDGAELQQAVRPRIVRVKVENSSGTGFVLASSAKGELLIATNHHVVGEAENVSVVFGETGKPATEIANVEVVKIDAQNDLALLKAPAVSPVKGLYLNTEPVGLGQRIAAVGYPFVKGSTEFTLTFEPGDVTATERQLGPRKFIQTNANINPGNSGGPVIDACGSVVGVVTAIHRNAQRVGLVVPVKHLIKLHAAYTAPPKSPEAGVRERLERFGKAIAWKQRGEAVGFFARSFLQGPVLNDFKKFLARARAREGLYAQALARSGINYASAPFAQKLNFLKKQLPRDEFLAWEISQLVGAGALGAYTGLRAYLSGWIVDTFGEVSAFQVVDVVDPTEKTAVAHVELRRPNGIARYAFSMHFEQGDWRISGFRCVRGCVR